jgi:uncharacterized membrane protein
MIPRLPNDRSEPPRLALSLAKLSAVGFSLVLCLQLASMELTARSSYTLSNVLGAPGRNVLLLSLGAGLLVPVLVGFLVFSRNRPGFIEQLEYWATVFAPLALTFVLPALFLAQVAEKKPLLYLVVLSAFGLALRALVAASLRAQGARRTKHAQEPAPDRPALRRWLRHLPALHLPRVVAFALVLFTAAGFAAYLGHYAVLRHRMLQTIDTDVGIADNLMANLLHARWFRAPAHFGALPANYLRVHPDYIALLFVPIYRLRPGAETLLWLQAALAGLSIVPLFLLSARLLGQRMAVWASAAYLLLSPLHGALVHGFSWTPAFCLFSFTLYYAVVAERRWLILFALPALLASSEAGPFAVFAFGVFLGVSRPKTGLAVGLCLVAALVFLGNTWLQLRAGSAQELSPLTAGLNTLLHNPVYFVLDLARAAKLTAMLHALAPFSLLPLAPFSSLPLLLPGLLSTSASSEFWPGSPASAQLQLLWVPGCLLSLLFTLRQLQQAPGRRALFSASVAVVSVALLSHSYDFGLLLRRDAMQDSGRSAQFKPTSADHKRYADLQSVVRRIPASASVVATTYMLSHVSNRTEVFDARRPYTDPDYVFFSTRELFGDARSAISATLSTHRYALVAHVEEFYLFRRAAETPHTGEALRTLGLVLPSP